MKKCPVIILLFCFIFLLAMVVNGCNGNKMKDCSYEIKSILLEGMKHLSVDAEENKLVDGRIVSTKIMFNNKAALTYLSKKQDVLLNCYSIIKNEYQGNDNKNALFVLALTNEMLYFLTGNSIEDRTRYLHDLQAKESHEISLWVMDDIFGPILRTDEELLKEWIRLDKNIKYMEIYNFLTSSVKK